jgi:hypothetical protein
MSSRSYAFISMIVCGVVTILCYCALNRFLGKAEIPTLLRLVSNPNEVITLVLAEGVFVDHLSYAYMLDY